MDETETEGEGSGARIWSYGCLAPTSGGEHLREQLRLAHHYYNALIAIHLDYLRGYREARAEFADLAPLEEEVADLTEQIDALSGRIADSRRRVPGAPRKPRAKGIRLSAADAAKQARLRATRAGLKDRLLAARNAAAAMFDPGDEALKLRTYEACLRAGATPILKKDGAFKGFASRTIEQIKPLVVEEMLREPEWPEPWKAKMRAQQDAGVRQRAARARSGLGFGTYLLVEAAVDAAKKPRPGRKGDPEPRQYFDGGGRVGVRLGVPVRDLLAGKCPKLQIRITDADRRRPRAVIRMDLGGSGKHAVVEFPVVLHRPLPPDAKAVHAWVSVRREGPRWVYQFQVTIKEPGQRRMTGRGAVALDLGWRKQNGSATDQGIRVAYAVDDCGREREYVVPQDVQDALDRASALRSHADHHFNDARESLLTWVAGHRQAAMRTVIATRQPRVDVNPHALTAPPTDPGPATETLRQAAQHAGSWKRKGHLASLAGRLKAVAFPDRCQVDDLWRAWKRERLTAKADLFDSLATISAWAETKGLSDVQQIAIYLEWWRRKNQHLYEYETGVRGRALRRRNDQFARWAAVLASTYETLVIEKFDLRKHARRKPKEEEDHDTALRRTRAVAAPGKLRNALQSAAGSKRVVQVNCANSTRECRHCHHVNTDWEDQSKLMQQCAGCERTWDQDQNAAYILLDRWGGAPTPKARRRVTSDAVSPSP